MTQYRRFFISSILLILIIFFTLNIYFQDDVGAGQTNFSYIVKKSPSFNYNNSYHEYSNIHQSSWEHEYWLGALPELEEPKTREVMPREAKEGLPSSFDWRNVDGKNWMTSVKSQGSCGSCVAFGTIGAMEACYKIFINESNLNLDLSEQHLFSCGGGSCEYGWYTSSALNYLKDNGTPDEGCYPYRAKDDSTGAPCSDTCPDWEARNYQIAYWQWLSIDREVIKAALLEGPLVTRFDVYDDFYSSSWWGGVYHHTWGSLVGGHCVVLVGYNEAGSYWIVKNSWGTSWNENGYFKMGYGEVGIENWVAKIKVGSEITIDSNPQGPNLIRIDDMYITTPTVFSWTMNSVHTLEAISPFVIDTTQIYSNDFDSSHDWTQWEDGSPYGEGRNFPGEGILEINNGHLKRSGEHFTYYLGADSPQIPISGIYNQFQIQFWWHAHSDYDSSSVTNMEWGIWRSDGIYVQIEQLCNGGAFDFYGNVDENIANEVNQAINDECTWITISFSFRDEWITNHNQEVEIDDIILSTDDLSGVKTRYIFSSWSDGGAQTHTYTTPSYDETITATYETQYYIEVISDYGSPTPSAWINEGQDYATGVTSPDGYYKCDGYKIDGGNLQPDIRYTFTNVQAPHTIEYFWSSMQTVLTLFVDGGSSTTKDYGLVVDLSGSINPAIVGPVSLYLSMNGGSSWSNFITCFSDSNGAYSIPWIPPYPGIYIYILKASWPGDGIYLGDESDPPYPTLTVTGSRPIEPRLLVSTDQTTQAQGTPLTISVLVFNGDNALTDTLILEITGPSGYTYRDFTDISIPANSRKSCTFIWNISDVAPIGRYRIEVGFIPPKLSACDIIYIQIT